MLFEIWDQRGLLTFNGVMYKPTIAGQFWQVNLAQSILECIQAILLDKSDIIRQDVAAQDNNQGTDPSEEKLLKITREIYPQISEDELKELVNMIPSHVKAMLKNMLPIMIKQVIKTMGQDKIQEMVEKARGSNR